jgi:hypothetical protein
MTSRGLQIKKEKGTKTAVIGGACSVSVSMDDINGPK